jgi:death-on-curing protein
VAPEFLDVDDVLRLHRAALARWGGMDGLRDPRGLEAAVAQAQATFDGEYLHGDLFSMAAAYAFHIAEGQAFVDGNKRTGLLAAIVFLDVNGFRIPEPEDAL